MRKPGAGAGKIGEWMPRHHQARVIEHVHITPGVFRKEKIFHRTNNSAGVYNL